MGIYGYAGYDIFIDVGLEKRTDKGIRVALVGVFLDG